MRYLISKTLMRYKQAILDSIFERLNKNDCIIFLFGTFAEGDTVRSSDIDIGILGRDKISDRDFVMLQEELNTNVPTLRKIDLVDFSNVDRKVREEALKEMEIWHIGKNCRELLKNLKQV